MSGLATQASPPQFQDAIDLNISLSCDEEDWVIANKSVIWGWKRDAAAEQRVILFSGTLTRSSDKIFLCNWFFFYRHRSWSDQIRRLYHFLDTSIVRNTIGSPVVSNPDFNGMRTVELAGGPDLSKNRTIVARLLRRRPRRQIPEGCFPQPTREPLNLKNYSPFVLYAGSGLSYEAGLPTLAEIHQKFGVDVIGNKRFNFGIEDPIPSLMSKDLIGSFNEFTSLHLAAAVARPSPSHTIIADWIRAGLIKKVYTDNIDNLFSKCGVAFERTRGIGIFNDRYEVCFEGSPTLLVIGVAADRRGIIAQARSRKCKVVIVNPQNCVSPLSQNMSYIRSNDVWYKMTAAEFFGLHGQI